MFDGCSTGVGSINDGDVFNRVEHQLIALWPMPSFGGDHDEYEHHELGGRFGEQASSARMGARLVNQRSAPSIVDQIVR
ncbi:MAG: hypothetical protein ACR2QH_03925 [Geminicoccaceae bacterium]